jgi:hypothetical protein
MAGFLFLLLVLTAAFTEFFARGRLSSTEELIAAITEVTCLIAVTLLFYVIFKPVNSHLSLLAVFFNIVALTLELLQFLPHGVNIGLGFHGLYWILIGYLILRSTFLPRFLGVLMAIAGLCWLTFLPPALASFLSPYNLAAALLVQGLVMLWLLVMGVNMPRGQLSKRLPNEPSATSHGGSATLRASRVRTLERRGRNRKLSAKCISESSISLMNENHEVGR